MSTAEFDAHQRHTARTLGYGDDVDAMNRDHDVLHHSMCRWLGVISHSMRVAVDTPKLTQAEQRLAALEETAVLALQKFIRLSGASVP